MAAENPLNRIKLELAVVLIAALTLYALLELLLDDTVPQLIGLGLYGVAGSVWLVVRTRRVVARVARDTNGDGM